MISSTIRGHCSTNTPSAGPFFLVGVVIYLADSVDRLFPDSRTNPLQPQRMSEDTVPVSS